MFTWTFGYRVVRTVVCASPKCHLGAERPCLQLWDRVPGGDRRIGIEPGCHPQALSSSPPIRPHLGVPNHFCRTARLRHKQRQPLCYSDLLQPFYRLPPSMQRQIEQPPVNRHQEPRPLRPTQGHIRARRPIRPEVYVLPELVEGPDLDHRQVERPIRRPNLRKPVPPPRIRAIKHRMLRALDHKRSP